MLRQVFITKEGTIIYKRKFGKALDDDGFSQAYKQVAKEAFQIHAEKNRFHDYFQYRINYLSIPDKQLLFMFVSDLSDKFENVKKELERCRKEFMGLFGEMLDDTFDEEAMEIFDPTMDLIHKNLRPKISLVGFSGVGKTTITRLITAEDIPMEHVPTITGDIGTIKIGKLHFHLWDFAGQEQFSFLWNNFIKGSDAVLLITDSTLENCEKSKYFTELIRKEAPYAHTAVIGNKQDLPEAMPIADIERILEMKAYSMIAVDPDNRDKMITIIADILEMSGEVSPLLKPLLKRDEKVKEAEEALEGGNFQGAVQIFEELADLSLELGDDRVSQDFHEKAEKIRSILQRNQATTQSKPEVTPPEPIVPKDTPPEISKSAPPIPETKLEEIHDSDKSLIQPHAKAPVEKTTEMQQEPTATNPLVKPSPIMPPKVNLPPITPPPNTKPLASKPSPPPAPPSPSGSKPPVSKPPLSSPPMTGPPAPPVAALAKSPKENSDSTLIPQKPSISPPPKPPVAPPTKTDETTISSKKIESIEAKEKQSSLQPPITPPAPPKPKPAESKAKTDLPASASPKQPVQQDQLGALLEKLKAKKQGTTAMSPPPKPPTGSVIGQSNKFAQPVGNVPPPPVSIPKPSQTPVPQKPESSTLIPPSSKQTEPTPSASSSAETARSDSAKIITELKIKMANVNKTLLDLEMENITGDLSDEEFEQKSKRLEAVKQKIKQQIDELKSF